jgi:hypothetical protein
MVQVVELLPPVEVVSVSVEPAVSFLQAFAKGTIAARPRAANPFFKKSFLSIMIDCYFLYAAQPAGRLG